MSTFIVIFSLVKINNPIVCSFIHANTFERMLSSLYVFIGLLTIKGIIFDKIKLTYIIKAGNIKFFYISLSG